MLDVIESNDHVTQRDLAGELGIALGLTNIYLKRCINKGLVKMRKAPARRYAYYLTAKGFSEKARLTAKYLSRSLTFFRLAREDCAELFAACERQGTKRVFLVGTGELCEIAVLAGLESTVEVVAILDEGTNRQHFAGRPVIRKLPELGASDAVVITDMNDPQGTYDYVATQLKVENVLFPTLLRLSTCRQVKVQRP